MVIWLLAVALAQEPQPRTSEEVDIYAEVLVERARRKVEQELLDAGYDEIIERDGKTIYRHPAPYRGEVMIDEDGWMRFKRQPVQVDAPGFGVVGDNSPAAYVGCVVWWFLCVRPGGQVVSKRKFQGYEWTVVGRVHDDVEQWGDRIADLATERKVNALPDRLDALWVHGTPLEGDAVLVTPEARRRALLAYWGSRTDTPWGEAVRESIEAFCRGVVQRSEHPFTDAEIAAFNASGVASRPFSLTSAPVTADVPDP